MFVLLQCPHCDETVQVFEKDIKCGIFRHGILKKTGKQIPPHAKKPYCDRLAKQKLIYGCGKPFQVKVTTSNPPTYKSSICGYI